MAFAFQRKVENEIDAKFSTFEQSNESKRNEFIVSISIKFFLCKSCVSIHGISIVEKSQRT